MKKVLLHNAKRSYLLLLAFPIIGLVCFIISEWKAWRKAQMQPRYSLAPRPDKTLALSYYPLDMSTLLVLPLGVLDNAGVPYNAATKKFPAAYHPTTISQYALANWNVYLRTKNEKYKQAFMIQARWLVEHEMHLANDAGGWPLPFSEPLFYAKAPWLSALTQGSAISVLLRAYCLTKEDIFLDVVRRAVHTFELNIWDGGVSTSIGDSGVFFEEAAVYPTAHILNGYLFALLGLYDYVALTNDIDITLLINKSLTTLHTLIDAFDMGYWSYYDLLHKNPASPFYHHLHILLLKVLAQYSQCEYCAAIANRWEEYLHNHYKYTRYFFFSRIARYRRALRRIFHYLLKSEIQYAHESLVFRKPVEFAKIS